MFPPQHPAAVAIFTALSSGRRHNRVAVEPRREKESPKNAFNRLSHTLYLKYHPLGTVYVLLL